MLLSKHKLEMLILLLAYTIIVSFIAILFKFNATLLTIAIWWIPSIYFLYRLKTFRVKLILSALVWGIPGSIIIDYLGHHNNAWSFWNNPLFSASSIQIVGIPIESFIWGFSFWLYYLLIYEYFFERHRTHRKRPIETIVTSILITVAAIILIRLGNGGSARIPYFFLILLACYMLFNLLLLLKYKVIFKKIQFYVIISFLIGLITELTSLILNLWEFSGEYIYIFSVSHMQLPIEEILWWAIIPTSIVLLHEIFSDSRD